PREEPGAGNPPARICEGESRMAELLDRDQTNTCVVKTGQITGFKAEQSIVSSDAALASFKVRPYVLSG
ncbi:hypothetical protein NKG99_33675, partial [Mesorhizobium sp. M1409]